MVGKELKNVFCLGGDSKRQDGCKKQKGTLTPKSFTSAMYETVLVGEI